MVSDIFPTAWFGARLPQVTCGDVVGVFGAGPVGQLAALSARMQGAGRVLIVDGNSKIASSQADPTTDWTQQESIPTVLRAYEAFDRRDPGWTAVTLELG
jgi:D-arabinose 1-dehydrogenase-like Zn-dependent alcohol dehydrogenase